MSQPLVSILIPAYRAARYIEETLASIAAQQWTNWEILVFEDGAFDDTAERVGRFAASVRNPVRLLRSATNLGVSNARNRLLDIARGDFIAFLDADDTWTPDHLAYSIERMQEEQSDWIISGLNLTDIHGRVTQANVLPERLPLERIPTRLLTYNFILTSGLVLRAGVFSRGLRFDPTLSIGEDLDLCIRIVANKHRVSYSTRATLNYRKHPASTTADPARFSERMSELYTKYVDNPLVDQEHCKKLLAACLLNTSKLTRKSEPKRCVAAARQLVRLRPWSAPAWAYWIAGTARSVGRRTRAADFHSLPT